MSYQCALRLNTCVRLFLAVVNSAHCSSLLISRHPHPCRRTCNATAEHDVGLVSFFLSIRKGVMRDTRQGGPKVHLDRGGIACLQVHWWGEYQGG